VAPDPGQWSAIANMSIARMRHQAVSLSPSRVMACGGLQSGSLATKTCEIFDSLTFLWSPTCDMTTPRSEFTMPLVPALDNSLAVGGYLPGASVVGLSSTEIGGCDHDKCATGAALKSGYGSCVASICAADPYCCSTAWDGLCVSEARTNCGSLRCSESDGACAHSLCSAGGSLASGCDSAKANCSATICATDSYCCTTAWDFLCIQEVSTLCGKTCY
jgi:hypothetical protein